MLITVTENGSPLTFNSDELSFVETLSGGEHKGRTRIVFKTGWVMVDQTHDQVVDALMGQNCELIRSFGGDRAIAETTPPYAGDGDLF